MKIKLKKSECLDNWFMIVRAEHDGREWWERVESGCERFMTSERLSPEACIEGTAEHMIGIATAIKERSMESFKRCEVRIEGDAAYFRSPKNSDGDVVVPLESADDLAAQILAELAPNQCPPRG